MKSSLVRAALVGAGASIPASALKAISETRLQQAAERIWAPTTQERELVGTDPSGHLENMPPAVLAERVARRLGHGPLSGPDKLRIQNVVHYGIGALSGATYGVLAAAFPSVTAGGGTAAGAAIYAAGHGTALPALRVQEPPWRLPRAAVAWEFTSHLFFGLVLELARRRLTRTVPAARNAR